MTEEEWSKRRWRIRLGRRDEDDDEDGGECALLVAGAMTSMESMTTCGLASLVRKTMLLVTGCIAAMDEERCCGVMCRLMYGGGLRSWPQKSVWRWVCVI